MTFLRLKVNFSSLQLTDICKKVTSHAKSSAELIFVVAKFFKARRTPRTVVPGYKEPCLQQRGEQMQKVPIKRFRNCLNDKFWLGTLFTVNLFLQLLAIIRSLQASIVYLASCLVAVKMVALQESSYRKEKRLQLLLERKKRLLTMSVCQELLVPLSLPLVSSTCYYPSAGQGSLLSVLIIYIFTLDPYHINTLR